MRKIWFFASRPGTWSPLCKVYVFRLLVWLDDPLADWWWRVSGLQAAAWRMHRWLQRPDR